MRCLFGVSFCAVVSFCVPEWFKLGIDRSLVLIAPVAGTCLRVTVIVNESLF